MPVLEICNIIYAQKCLILFLAMPPWLQRMGTSDVINLVSHICLVILYNPHLTKFKDINTFVLVIHMYLMIKYLF